MPSKSVLIQSVFLVFLSVLAATTGWASPEPAAVVSAASFEEQIAPGSIASLFGSGLATESLTAELDIDGLLPTELGGVSVEVNGQPAGLIFVSPLQINFYIDPATSPGPVTITVRVNGESGALSTTIHDVAPGLFLLPCVRFDRGAVLEGISSALESFHATNPSSASEDKRTRLTLWGTGIRFAATDGESNAASLASLTLSVGSVIGGGSVLGTVTLTGPAPAGGSQVTLVSSDAALGAPASVLVPEGQTSAQFLLETEAVPVILASTLEALLGECPGVQVELDILAPILQSLGIADSSFPLIGGSTTATVTLSGPAPAGGIAVQLEGSQESIILGLLGGLLKVVVPTEVVVPEGQTSGTFDVSASLVGTLSGLLSDHDGSITATLGATIKTVDLVIEGAL